MIKNLNARTRPAGEIRPGSRSSRDTPSTSSSPPPSGGMAAGRAGSPTSTSLHVIRPRGVDHAGQDLQGPHRRAADLADRPILGAGSPAYGSTVYVEPSTVVEIACDGLQVSTRYPGGVALRFARVLRYRPDKSAAEADTIDTVKALSPIIDGS